MSPILGIWASAQSGSLLANSYESIATVTVGAGGSSTITFSSIPSTYKHLQLRNISRTSGGDFNDLVIQFNSDTGNNYAWHRIYGTGASATAGAATSTGNIIALNTGSVQSASVFATNIIDVLDYQNSNKYKTARILGGADNNGSGYIQLFSGLWQNTNAITSITLTGQGGNFVQYSSFALYGIKG